MKNSKCDFFFFEIYTEMSHEVESKAIEWFARVPSSQALKCGEELGPHIRKSFASEVSIDEPHSRFLT